jgi:L-iditol 2-dehydrogenase
VELGADVVLSIEDTEPAERVERIRELTGGRGADVVLEAAGNPRAVPEGFQLLRDGGTYVIAGHYTDVGSVEINAHLDINLKHADVRGQWGTAFRHVVRALTLLQKYELPFARVIGARYGLDETNQALADVAALDVTKAIVTPNA